jgi:polyisoprenoid-binding protein YceI
MPEVTMRFRLMPIVVALILIACDNSSAASPDAAARYEVKPVYTNITFAITKWMVMREEGTFREFTGSLDYDPAHPEQARVEMVVQTDSIDTKISGRDHALRSPDFLNVARYPTMTFRSTSVKPIDADHASVSGDLTIHGVTKRVTFPAKLVGMHDVPEVGNVVGFEARFNINRRDFGVLGDKWGAIPSVLSNEVEIHIAMGAVRRRG